MSRGPGSHKHLPLPRMVNGVISGGAVGPVSASGTVMSAILCNKMVNRTLGKFRCPVVAVTQLLASFPLSFYRDKLNVDAVPEQR